MLSSPHQAIRQSILSLVVPESWGIYINELLRRISTSMVGLFIPIYIYQQTGELVSIPIYFSIYALFALISDYPSTLIIKRIGIDRALAVGSLFRALFLYSLIFAEKYHPFFWVSAFFFGLTQPFDWLPYHYSLAKMAQTGRQFSSIASLSKTVTRLGSTLGPLLGGMIIVWFGFPVLYACAGFLILVAAIVPFLDKFEKTGMHVSGSEIWQRLTDPGMPKHLLVIGLENFEGLISMMIWPVFLFTAMESYEKTGSLETISLLVGIVTLYGVKLFIKAKKYWVMTVGALLIVLSWLGRIYGGSFAGLTLANIGYITGTSFLWVPVWSLLYKHSVTQKYTMEFWLVHHIIAHSFLLLSSMSVVAALLLWVSLEHIILATMLVFSLSLVLPLVYREYIKKYG